jgi:hypothetical protein
VEKKRVLLVQPDYPIPPKRRNHHEDIPIGLLKIGTYLRDSKGIEVELAKGCRSISVPPDEIWITSLFTYWSKYVIEASIYYRSQFPNSRIVVGGIWASLMPDEVGRLTKADEVHVGLHHMAESWCMDNGIDYSLLGVDVDFQIIHAMRGCFRKCAFCGTWKIEDHESFDTNFPDRIIKNKVIFYDNNFLRNPNIRDCLRRMAKMRIDGKSLVCESQSGFDGRILDQELAILLKEAGFRNPRIAWDNSIDDFEEIRRQVGFLVKAGFKPKDIYVFVLYNWKYPYEIMEEKRMKCYELGVQIADCRFRPLDQLSDRYNGRLPQSGDDYYIHPKWDDLSVKQYRSNVRKHNICIRHGLPFHSGLLERKQRAKEIYASLKSLDRNGIRAEIFDAWYPDEFTVIRKQKKRLEEFGESLI